MNHFSVDAHLFHAIAGFSARQDIRYYLNGIYIGPLPAGGVVLVATNGTAMGIVRDPDGSVSAPLIVKYSEAMQRVYKKAKNAGKVQLRADFPRVELVSDLGVSLYVEPDAHPLIDGSFPDWKKVVPKADAFKDTMKPAWVKPALMEPVIAAAKILHNEFARVMYRTDESCLVRFEGAPDFLAIVMPGRVADMPFLPEWLGGYLELSEKSAEPQASAPLESPS